MDNNTLAAKMNDMTLLAKMDEINEVFAIDESDIPERPTLWLSCEELIAPVGKVSILYLFICLASLTDWHIDLETLPRPRGASPRRLKGRFLGPHHGGRDKRDRKNGHDVG